MTDIDKETLENIHNSDELIDFLIGQVLEYGSEENAIMAWSGEEATRIHTLILFYSLEMDGRWFTTPFIYKRYRCVPPLRKKVQNYKRLNAPRKPLIGSSIDATISL